MNRIERARAFRAKVEHSAKYLPDDEAFDSADLFPLWRGDEDYEADDRRRWGDKLYKSRKAHTSQAHYTPDMIPALWIVVSDGTRSGTKDDPIEAARGMEYTYGLYYHDPEDGKTYLCTRAGAKDGETVVLQFLPHELIGHYFSLA